MNKDNKALINYHNPECPILLIPLKGKVAGIIIGSAISWGNDTENDDWETPTYTITIELSEKDKARGFLLKEIEIVGVCRQMQNSSRPMDKEFLEYDLAGTSLEGLTEGSEIVIKGPLYRSDIAMFGGWSSRPLTEEEKEEVTTVNFGSTSSHTISLGQRPELQKLPPLSIKTAVKARASLEEMSIIVL